MTPLEILAATIQGQPTPRIPIFCNLLDQGALELGLSQQDYYAKGEYVAEAQLRMQARYGYDNVWSLFYVGREAELLGCQHIRYANHGTPTVADFIIKNYDDIAKLDIPNDITDHPIWQETAQCLSILKAEVGATHSICAYVTASTTLPAMLMGMENWLELLLTGPDDIRNELLRKCSDFFQQQITAYRAAGANLLFYATPFSSRSFVNLNCLQNKIMPWLKRDLSTANVADIVYFCAMAPFNNTIELIKAELGVRAFYISPLADLAEAKQLIGTQGLTCGVLNDIPMIHGTPEQIRAEVKKLCDIGKPNGHFLFGTTLMPMKIPKTNIQTLFDAVFKYGSYP